MSRTRQGARGVASPGGGGRLMRRVPEEKMRLLLPLAGPEATLSALGYPLTHQAREAQEARHVLCTATCLVFRRVHTVSTHQNTMRGSVAAPAASASPWPLFPD
ncbi:hypothetical protein MTO96_023218 [Rhipicephalus appendiculatus]